jgi:hypothetical protein
MVGQLFPRKEQHTMKRIAMVIALVIIVALFVAPYTIFANMHSNTIDPVATVGEQGKFGYVTALIACTAGERLSVRVTVTQEDANSVAEGRTYATCTEGEQRLKVRVWAQTMTRLGKGPADACALAMTQRNGRVIDTRQWCKAVALNDE